MFGPLAAGLLAVVGAGGLAPDAVAVQGSWTVASFVEQGEVVDPKQFPTVTYTFAGDKLTLSMAGKVMTDGKFALDPARSPRHLDVANGEGIYRLAGDELLVCLPAFERKVPRPERFDAPAGSGLMLMELKRVRK